MNVREIDFISESEDSLKDKFLSLPLPPRDVVFTANQLVQNNKCPDIFKKCVEEMLLEDHKYLSMITKAALTQTKNPKYFSIIINVIQHLEYRDKEKILEDAFQSTCTAMRDEMFDYCLEVIHDMSFKNNVIYFLLRNNQNVNADKIKCRPEVIHNAFLSNQEEIIENIDKDEFYDQHPEYYL